MGLAFSISLEARVEVKQLYFLVKIPKGDF
jgi:hypothetical protein